MWKLDQVKNRLRSAPRSLPAGQWKFVCISGISALTISTPPSAYRKMAFGNHTMVRRSMTKECIGNQDKENVSVNSNKPYTVGMVNYLKISIFQYMKFHQSKDTKKVVTTESSTSSKTGNTEPTQTDFRMMVIPYLLGVHLWDFFVETPSENHIRVFSENPSWWPTLWTWQRVHLTQFSRTQN